MVHSIINGVLNNSDSELKESSSLLKENNSIITLAKTFAFYKIRSSEILP
jgi:hypothetical protein